MNNIDLIIGGEPLASRKRVCFMDDGSMILIADEPNISIEVQGSTEPADLEDHEWQMLKEDVLAFGRETPTLESKDKDYS